MVMFLLLSGVCLIFTFACTNMLLSALQTMEQCGH